MKVVNSSQNHFAPATCTNTPISLSSFKIARIIEDNFYPIKLSNGKIATCCTDLSINILNPSNDFKCELKLNGHTNKLSSIAELENKNIEG